jgi:hypothetical protein
MRSCEICRLRNFALVPRSGRSVPWWCMSMEVCQCARDDFSSCPAGSYNRLANISGSTALKAAGGRITHWRPIRCCYGARRGDCVCISCAPSGLGRLCLDVFESSPKPFWAVSVGVSEAADVSRLVAGFARTLPQSKVVCDSGTLSIWQGGPGRAREALRGGHTTNDRTTVPCNERVLCLTAVCDSADLNTAHSTGL